jgi:hypothetical protein
VVVVVVEVVEEEVEVVEEEVVGEVVVVAAVVVRVTGIGAVDTAAGAVVVDEPSAQPARPVAARTNAAVARNTANTVLRRRAANDTSIGRRGTATPS